MPSRRFGTHAPPAGGRGLRGGGAAVVLTLLIALVEAVEAAADWHRAQEHRAQARAAAEAAVLLRAAAGLTGAPPRPRSRAPVEWCARRAVACPPLRPLPVYRPARARDRVRRSGRARPVRADPDPRKLPMTSGYPPEPFAEALGEAAHTAAMAYRLVLAISDAVRRAAQKRLTGREEELGEDAEKMAPGWSADQLRGHLSDDVLAVLMQDADWPQMARRLVGLQQAGVDLGVFLPQMGRMTAGVHQAVTANAARIKAEGTDRWADLLEATMPEGLVRDAILASPAWPDIAAAMGRLDAAGIDVARILTDAHRAGAGVDQAVAAVTAAAADTPTSTTAPASAPAAPTAAPAAAAPAPAPAPAAGARVPADDPWAPPTRPIPARAPAAPAPARGAAVGAARDVLAERMGAAGDPWAAPARPIPAPAPAPTPAPAPAGAPVPAPVPASADAKRVWGPLTEGLTVPRDLDLGNRPRALKQLKVQPAAHSRMVAMIKLALPEREAGLLIGSRPWPLLAARMQQLGEHHGTDTVAQHLNRLTTGTSWQEATGSALVGCLVDATLMSLTTPPGAPAPARPRVSAAAARSRSTTTPAAAAPGWPAPTEAAVPAHRHQAAPVRGTGRAR
ncbi:hypothetical protein [Streptomyces virginiae]|uniref:hypothetical protein n=1 Tax=Streptomyces virginiae TaxID=1961 RepID=UPI0036E3AB64